MPNTVDVIESSLWDPSQPMAAWVKGYEDRTRETADVDTILLHITAVEDGYGASAQAVERMGSFWAAIMERFEGSEYLSQKDLDKGEDGNKGRVGAPYHYVLRPQEGVIIALHHPQWETWHGNGGNDRSIGVAVDMGEDDEIDADWLAAALVQVTTHSALHGFGVSVLEGHRQHSSARGGDPGPRVWPVAETALVELGIVPSLTRTTGSGQTIPPSWRPDDAETPTPPPSSIPSTRDQVTAVQVMLDSWGHDPGVADGIWGKNSERALASWVAAVG